MKNEPRILLLLLGDIVMLVVAFWLMLFVSFSETLNKNIIHLHALPFFILSIIWIVIFFIFNLYNPETSRPSIPHLQQIFIAFIVAGVVGVIFFYIFPSFNITPKTNLLIFGTTDFILLVLWRRIFYNIFSSYFRKSVVFITSGKNNILQVNDLNNYINTHPQSGFFVVGLYDSLEKFFDKYQQNFPQIFIVSKEVWHNPEDFKKLYSVENQVMDLAYAYEDILGRIPIEIIDEGWFIHNVRSYKKKIYDLEKRFSSIIIAGLLLIITSPILLIIALAIKLYDSGPIFYSQMRVGKDSKNFKLYKLRSMIVNADCSGAEWTTKNDPRITKIGKIIRKLHIDEIPQLWNVLKGEMTLVGPRPEIPSFADKLEKEVPYYNLRHIIHPGFSGWAQIKFRNAQGIEESKEKFEYDLYYIKNRNIFMDFGIILRTIQIIFTH